MKYSENTENLNVFCLTFAAYFKRNQIDRYLAEAMQDIIGYCGDRTKMQVFMLMASDQQDVQLCLNQPMSEGAFPPITTQ